jgi:hypothetical protein
LGDDAVSNPVFAVGPVKENAREALGGESAVAKLCDFRIDADVESRHLGCGDPGVGTECCD